MLNEAFNQTGVLCSSRHLSKFCKMRKWRVWKTTSRMRRQSVGY